jgi:glycosyltransferase involved in cell wall biosynthesis
MRILYVTHEFPPYIIGGTGLYTWHLSRALARTDQVFVFSRLTDPVLPDYGPRDEEQDGVTIRYVNRPEPEWVPLYRAYEDPRLAGIFEEWVRRIRPDVIHFQHLYAMSIDLIDVAKRFGIPALMTLHDYWAMCPMGQRLCWTDLTICEVIDTRKCGRCILGNEWEKVEEAVRAAEVERDPGAFVAAVPAERGAPRLLAGIREHRARLRGRRGWTSAAWLGVKDVLGYWFTPRNEIEAPKIAPPDPFLIRHAKVRNALLKLELLISPSAFLREEFVTRFGIPAEKIVHSSNGMDLLALERREKTEAERLRFGFVGGVMKAKGVHVLVEAFLLAAAKRNDIELHIHGGASRWSREYLESLIARAAGNDRVRFHGPFDNRRIAEVLSGVDVLVVPSIWYENAPLTLNEALITGTPVITSDSGGMAEFVRTFRHGTTFRLGDPADLARVIESFAADRSLLRSTIAPPTPMKSIEANAAELRGRYEALAGKAGPIPIP